MNKEQFTDGVLAAEKSLYRVARSILGNDEDCADAIQNAILHAYGGLHALRQEEYFKTWLTRILINECQALLKGRKKQVPYEEYMKAAENGPAESGLSREPGESSEVFQAVEELPEKYRLPFVLHYVEGYSVRELAQMLHLSEGNVKTRLYRSRNLLKRRLEGVAEYEEYKLG